jgi:hypothetical protein
LLQLFPRRERASHLFISSVGINRASLPFKWSQLIESRGTNRKIGNVVAGGPLSAATLKVNGIVRIGTRDFRDAVDAGFGATVDST